MSSDLTSRGKRTGYDFRVILPAPDSPRLADLAGRDAYQHTDALLAVPVVGEALQRMMSAMTDPYVGITTDGTPLEGLYERRPEGAPTEAMVAAARALLAVLTEDERALVRRDIDSPHWRGWSNPELYLTRQGLRLEEVRPEVCEAVLTLVEASLSPEGYRTARDCMRMNEFLGHLVHAPKVMNELSYNILVFGRPSLTEPWGWNLWGHHLCLNCFVLGEQMVLSPTFMGAEPTVIDEGPHAGLRLFAEEERRGLDLMRSLAPEVQERAQIYALMHDPAMPPGRWHPADQRHQAGMFQDNRVIPYEGVPVSTFSADQRRRLLDLVELFLRAVPDGPRVARLDAIGRRLDDTWFAWIGGYDEDDVFYYKIHSPVVLIEFDHHSGVFLTNREPWRCHIHTVVRTPNGNDYGKALLRQHEQDES